MSFFFYPSSRILSYFIPDNTVKPVNHCYFSECIYSTSSDYRSMVTSRCSHKACSFFQASTSSIFELFEFVSAWKNLRHAIASQAALALLQPRQHISVGARSSLPLHFHQGYAIPEYNWPIRGGISLLLANSVFSKEDETKKLIRCMTSNSVYELAFPSVPSLHAPPGTVQLL